jgi:hypothetical protein
VIEGRRGVLVQLGDNTTFDGHEFYEMMEGGGFCATLRGLSMVVFQARPGNVEFDVDWTDRPSLFHDRGSDEEPDVPLDLETVRDVRSRVWGVMAALILLYIATALFLRPVSPCQR